MKVEIYLSSRLSVKLAPPNPKHKFAKATAEKRETVSQGKRGKAEIGKDKKKNPVKMDMQKLNSTES